MLKIALCLQHTHVHKAVTKINVKAIKPFFIYRDYFLLSLLM